MFNALYISNYDQKYEQHVILNFFFNIITIITIMIIFIDINNKINRRKIHAWFLTNQMWKFDLNLLKKNTSTSTEYCLCLLHYFIRWVIEFEHHKILFLFKMFESGKSSY